MFSSNDVNAYGMAIDYLDLIEQLYDHGVSQTITLKIRRARTPHYLKLDCLLHLRGVDHRVEIDLNVEPLLNHEEASTYLTYIARDVAGMLGQLVFLRNG